MGKRIDITGKKFHNLLAVEFVGRKNSHAIWRCKCLRCGNETVVSYSNLVSGNSKSCQSCGQIKLTKQQDEEVADMYEKQKMSLRKIASTYNVSVNAIRSSLRRNGVEIRDVGRRSKSEG